jgi:hypothetical protein
VGRSSLEAHEFNKVRISWVNEYLAAVVDEHRQHGAVLTDAGQRLEGGGTSSLDELYGISTRAEMSRSA